MKLYASCRMVVKVRICQDDVDHCELVYIMVGGKLSSVGISNVKVPMQADA